MENDKAELFREIYEKTYQDKIAHSFYSHPLREMAKVGLVGDYKIYVYGGEGLVPHFHFINIHTGREGCIKILTNEYFNHGSKYNLILNSGERKELVRFFEKSPDKKPFTEATNFQMMIQAWNMGNSENEVSLDTPIPNYQDM